MNRKKLTFEIIAFLFAVIFVFVGCQQPVETGNENGRDSAFEKGSLLVEVWDSSTPPQFLGYDTGLAYYGSYSKMPIILTSKGYCVQLKTYVFYNDLGYTDEYGNPVREYITKVLYGKINTMTDAIATDELNEKGKNNGFGDVIIFKTTSDPTTNDTPYAFGGSNIVNEVLYNPHNGGTYYTVDHNATRTSVTIQGNYKFYDLFGTTHTWNDDVYVGYMMGVLSTSYIGEILPLSPLKKIGGYAELGLPDPATVTPVWVYKVK